MKRLAALLTGMMLVACGSAEQGDQAPVTPAATEQPTPGPDSDEDVVPELVLEPLQEGDGSVISDAMTSVGGCSFHDEEGNLLISVGKPDNYDLPEGAGGPAIGVARPGGKLTKLTADKADAGYVERGPALQGDGVTLLVRRGEGKGKSVLPEILEWSARLVVADAEGNKRRYTLGKWRCGT